jgi:hypothetical protein
MLKDLLSGEYRNRDSGAVEKVDLICLKLMNELEWRREIGDCP